MDDGGNEGGIKLKPILGLGITLFLAVELCIGLYSAHVLAAPNIESSLEANSVTGIKPAFFAAILQQTANHVVINEFELNPPENDNSLTVEEWVELYNPTSVAVDISGWTVSTTHGIPTTIFIPSVILAANDYYVIGQGSQWLDNDDESIVLKDSEGTEIDSTPTKSDGSDNSYSWQRYYDGQNNWEFRQSTKGVSNGVDTTPPVITIQSPVTGQSYAESSVPLTFSVNEDTVWLGYSLNGGANVTVSGSTVLTGLSDGDYNVIVYAEDTAGYVGSSNVVNFSVDATSPTVSVVSPENKNYTTTSLGLTFTVNEPTSWIGYSLDGALNVTIAGNVTLTNLSENQHTIIVYARDLSGNTGTSNMVTFNVQVPVTDSTPPIITLYSPQSTTYSNSNVLLSFSINEDTSWISYSLDGQSNQTITGDTTLTGLSDGEHDIVVYAEDVSGNVGKSTLVTFSINTTSTSNLSPVADAGGPYSGTIDESISFNGGGSYDIDGEIVSYFWDFGDSSTSTDQNPTHAYTQEGTYAVTLTVTDNDELTNTDTTTVTVNEPTSHTAPIASFNCSPEFPESNKTVNFDASNSSSPEGTVDSYDWNFGDGTNGTGITTAHSYSSDGSYVVTLTVTNNYGLTDVVTRNIVVISPADSNEPTKPTAPTEQPEPVEQDVTSPLPDAGNDMKFFAEAVVTFNASKSTDNVGIVSYEWDFGDGTTGTGLIANHTYTKPGNYTFTLTVHDEAGNSATDSGTITIQAIERPTTIREPLPISYAPIVALSETVAVAAYALLVTNAFSSTISVTISKLRLPDWLKEFLQLCGEDISEKLDRKVLSGNKEQLFSKKELASVLVSAIIMIIVLCFIEANSLDNFLNPSVIIDIIPYVLIAVLMENVVEVFAEVLSTKLGGVYKQVNLWLYGLLMLLGFSFILHIPIGSPIITRYQNKARYEKKEGLIIISKLLIILALTFPFTGLYIFGFELLGDTGMLVTLVTAFYYSMQLIPISNYKKWAAILAVFLTGALFFSFILNILPHEVYLATGAFSVVFAVITLHKLSRT